MRLFLIISICLILTNNLAAQSLNPESFKAILLEADLESEFGKYGDAKLLVDELGISCAKVLQKMYKNKQKFEFKTIEKRTYFLKNYYKNYLKFIKASNKDKFKLENQEEYFFKYQERYLGFKNNIFYHYFYWDKDNNSTE